MSNNRHGCPKRGSRHFSITLLFCALTFCAYASDRIDLGVGTVELPKGFTHKRGQGIDSLVGRFMSSDGAVVINYDIGPMAGVYAANSSNKPVRSSSNLKAGTLTGLFIVFGPDTRRAIVSFPTVGPTNFFIHVRKDSDIDTLKKLAATFKPKTPEK
jgi:hypothetical protein